MDSIRNLVREAGDNPRKVYRKADSLLQKAQQQKNRYAYAAYLLVKGVAHSQQGKRSQALTEQAASFRIFDSLQDNKGRAMSLACISFTNMELDNFKKAHFYLLQAQKYAAPDDYHLQSTIAANLAIVYYETKDYTKAIAANLKALDYFKSVNNHYSTAITYHGLACCYHKLQQLDKALYFERIAMEYQAKSKSDFALAMIATFLGQLYLENGDMELAKKYLDIGGTKVDYLNANFKKEYLKSMIKWHKARKLPEKALYYTEQYIKLKDSLYSIDSIKMAFETEERFQNRLKNNEIKLLKTQKKLDDTKAYEAKVWTFVLIVIAILFSIIILVLYRNFQLSKKAKALLEAESQHLKRQNQQLEIENILVQFETLKNQISPHFLFNSLNALISLIRTDPDKAVRFASEFSKIFRNTLELKDRNLITLGEELQHVESYLFLQKMRFGSNLQVDSAITPEAKNHYLLPFSLQMVIENAVKHNEISNEKPLTISIATEPGFLMITNNLQHRKSMEESTKTGIANIKQRYRYITDVAPVFEMQDTHFKVQLPLLTADSV